MLYHGHCHCRAVEFSFEGEEIVQGLRCNCSLCEKKGAIMTQYAVAPNDINISVAQEALASYSFASLVAKHYFCKRCGIYTFHQTMSKPGYYRINIGCVVGINASCLPFNIHDGASV